MIRRIAAGVVGAALWLGGVTAAFWLSWASTDDPYSIGEVAASVVAIHGTIAAIVGGVALICAATTPRK